MGGTLASRTVPTPPRRRPPSLAAAALVVILSSCRASPPPPAAKPSAAAVTDRVRVFLIAPHDGGRSGAAAGCGDSAVPVEITLPAPAPALAGALRALLAMSDPLDARSGLSNPLYASSLELARVERAGGEARVELRGYLELSDDCEGRRILAQLRATALQFQGVDRASFTVDGEPLPSLLAQAAASAPTAAAGP
jgi:hypothetical protein